MRNKICILLSVICLILSGIKGQNKIQLSLSKAIELSNDSSIAAFRAKNLFLASYWDYKNYIAESRPIVSLNVNPFSYDRSIAKQFNSVDTSYNYYKQQNLNSSASLNLTQNVSLTGGKVYVNSDLGRFQNFGTQSSTQFSSTPVRIGFNQPLFGFNPYKWEKKLAPLKYEKAKKEFITSYEKNAITVVDYFFNFATAEQNFKIARINYANADTLYSIGQKRFDISTITRSDLLNLNLELLNSKDQLSIAKNNLERARSLLLSVLNLNKDIQLDLILPEEIPELKIDVSTAIGFAKKNNPNILNLRQQELEANRDVEIAKKASQFTASLDASFGLNQSSVMIKDVYKNPIEQDAINVSLSIPIIDWGLRKGRYNLASKQREALVGGLRQSEIDFEQEVVMTISEFNIQKDLINSSMVASKVANEAYEICKNKFIIGQIDVNNLIIQLSRKDATQRNYISALQNYWKYYYTVRNLTLFDFEKNESLDVNFDKKFRL